MEAEFNRLQAIDFNEKRKDIEQMLRIRREQEHQRRQEEEQERLRQEALKAQSSVPSRIPLFRPPPHLPLLPLIEQSDLLPFQAFLPCLSQWLTLLRSQSPSQLWIS